MAQGKSTKAGSLRKRQQIANSNRTMFMWVVAASVVIAFTAVGAQFIFKQALFNAKVISAKTEARDNLKANLAASEELKDNVNKLIADPNLATIKNKPDDVALQVVLDALPTDGDATVLATSLQQVILARSGVTIENLTTSTDTLSVDEELAEETSLNNGPSEVPFEFEINGSYEQINNALKDIERTIRPISIKTMTLEGNDANLKLNAKGITYYVPAKSIEITQKAIKS